MMVFRTWRIAAVVLALLPVSVRAEEVTVFAASSLKTALDEIAANWSGETGNRVTISYAGSPQLALQIEAGAPAAIFLSAAVDWMDMLDANGRLVDGSRRDLLGNTLVLIAHGAGMAPVVLDGNLDLAGMLDGGFLAMALTDSVPAGVYGKQALMTLGLWEEVAGSVAQAESARAALALVALGETPFGVVFGSDAVAEPKVTAIATFPAESHAPIIYPAALVAGYDTPAAADFLDYLSSEAADAVFAAQGFAGLPDAGP
jgi:molybdate transport system substrate-binding protein